MTANRNANAAERGCPMPGNAPSTTPPPLLVDASTTTPPALVVDRRNAARILAVSERTVWSRTVPRGDLPCVRVGARVLYSVDTLRAWVVQQEVRVLNGNGDDAPDGGLGCE